ncbi:MAG: Uma2 family endonuclease [Ardenticatenaceae bacterium]
MGIQAPVATELQERKEVRLRMTYEEFLDWSDEDTHAEWVNGEVTVFMPPKNIHQVVLGFLYHLMRLFVDLFDPGELRVAPFEMKAKPGGSSREPDILFVKTENRHRINEYRLQGAADLVVEIVSTESVTRDKRDKLQEYAEAGVPEYWIVDPRSRKQEARFYRLTEQGLYELFGSEQDEWIASHVLPGFRLRPAWLWQAESLNPLTCALQIPGVVAQLAQQIEQAQRDGTE